MTDTPATPATSRQQRRQRIATITTIRENAARWERLGLAVQAARAHQLADRIKARG